MRGGLLPHPFTLSSCEEVCFLLHFPWGRPRRALPGTVFPWSPDFPPLTIFRRCKGRPSSQLVHLIGAKNGRRQRKIDAAHARRVFGHKFRPSSHASAGHAAASALTSAGRGLAIRFSTDISSYLNSVLNARAWSRIESADVETKSIST
jgi:hypothetical protein